MLICLLKCDHFPLGHCCENLRIHCAYSAGEARRAMWACTRGNAKSTSGEIQRPLLQLQVPGDSPASFPQTMTPFTFLKPNGSISSLHPLKNGFCVRKCTKTQKWVGKVEKNNVSGKILDWPSPGT